MRTVMTAIVASLSLLACEPPEVSVVTVAALYPALGSSSNDAEGA